MTNQKLKKLQGNLFVVLIILIISFIYFSNVKLIWMDRRPDTFLTYLYLIIFNIFAFMLAWSLITTIFTDPVSIYKQRKHYYVQILIILIEVVFLKIGQMIKQMEQHIRIISIVGYFLDDNEHKKRRYCLICHIFKPERTHHCSACNRCVLNMDHHCPWLGNCIGFANRKFFILLLFYVNVTTWLASFGMVGEIFNIIITIKNKLQGDPNASVSWFSDFLIVAAFGLDITAIFIIGIFFKFHIDLILMNTTTIENLDRKRSNPSTSSANIYDMGQYYNFVQVFGAKVGYWPFPFFFEDARPVGDGILWPQRVKTDTEMGLNNNSPSKTNNTSHNNNHNLQQDSLIDTKGMRQNQGINSNVNMSTQQQQQQQQFKNFNNTGPMNSNYQGKQNVGGQQNQGYQNNNNYRNQM